ncbi:cell cycle checkpoint protein RAD17, partial [Thalictrum thalictroides]
LDFLSDEAVDDAWTVASYLCDADNLATFHASMWSRTANNQEVDSISHLAAASVAVRGVLFGNSHPTQSRWHAIRSPRLWQAEQLLRRNKNEMVRQRNEANRGLISSDISIMATEYKPMLLWLGSRAFEAPIYMEELQDCQIGEDTYDGTKMDEDVDDDIEDW